MPVSCCNGYIESVGSLLNAHASEISQLDQVGCRGVFVRQFLKSIVNGQELIGRGVAGEIGGIDIQAAEIAAAFMRGLATSLIDKNSAHRFGRGGEEVTAAVPPLLVFVADQPQIGFMHKRGRLEGLTGLFGGELRRRQLPELVVHKRQEFVGGLPVTLLNLRQNLGDFGHRRGVVTQGCL